MKPQQSKVNLQNAKCPLTVTRHKFKRKDVKGLVSLDASVSYSCTQETCSLTKIYSLCLQNLMMVQSKTFLSKLNNYFLKNVMLRVTYVLLPMNFCMTQLSALV